MQINILCTYFVYIFVFTDSHSKCPTSKDFSKLKLASKNLIRVYYMHGKDSNTWNITSCFREYTWSENRIKSEPKFRPKYSAVESGHNEHNGNGCVEVQSLSALILVLRSSIWQVGPPSHTCFYVVLTCPRFHCIQDQKHDYTKTNWGWSDLAGGIGCFHGTQTPCAGLKGRHSKVGSLLSHRPWCSFVPDQCSRELWAP